MEIRFEVVKQNQLKIWQIVSGPAETIFPRYEVTEIGLGGG